MTEKEIGRAMGRLNMVVATEDGSVSSKLVNVDKKTMPLLRKLKLEEYLPD